MKVQLNTELSVKSLTICDHLIISLKVFSSVLNLRKYKLGENLFLV